MRKVTVAYPEKEAVEGWFHVWGGTNANVYAIVELADGKIIQPYADYVKFNPDEQFNAGLWEPI